MTGGKRVGLEWEKDEIIKLSVVPTNLPVLHDVDLHGGSVHYIITFNNLANVQN